MSKALKELHSEQKELRAKKKKIQEGIISLNNEISSKEELYKLEKVYIYIRMILMAV